MRFLTMILILLLLVAVAPAFGEINSSPHLYLLVDTPDGPVIERVSLAMGEEILIDDDQVISFILPLGSGQSGDLVKAADPKARLLVSSSEQGITVSVKRPDGTTRSYPEISYADLAAVDMRLNIISGSGDKLAYMLRGYESVESDSGPVIDMFRGMIPMAPGDYTVTSEVIPRAPVLQVAGAAELRICDDDPAVSVELPGGKRGDFIMDIGAGATAIGRKWLPAGTEITKLIGMEYSSSGTREVPGTMGGAGGDVGGFLGIARIPFLKIGDIVFEDVRVSVVEEMPAFGGHPFAGILGLDLLSRAETLSFAYGAGTMAMGPATDPTKSGKGFVEIPFQRAAKHLFLQADIDGSPLTLMLDTGARASLISERLARAMGFEKIAGRTRKFMGLDGNAIPAAAVKVPAFTLGENSFAGRSMYAAELVALSALGMQDGGAILGNDFFVEFSQVELDFSRKLLRLFN